MTKQELLSKKNLIIGGIVLVVVVLALVYFLIIPGKQVSSYKKSIATNQSQLRDKINKVSEFLSSNAYTSVDAEDSEITAEIKKTREAIKDAESTLNATKADLTGFKALPLLGGDKYKTAKDIRASEQKYITDTENYFKELKLVLDYMEKQLEATASLTTFENDIALAEQSAATLPEYGAALEPAVKKVRDAYGKYKNLTPPTALKEAYDYDIKASEELLGLYDQLIVAAKADDVEKFLAIGFQQVGKTSEVATKVSELQKKFVDEGTLSKAGDALKELGRSIESKAATL